MPSRETIGHHRHKPHRACGTFMLAMRSQILATGAWRTHHECEAAG